MWSGAGKSETLIWEDESKIGFNFSQKEFEDALYQHIKINKKEAHGPDRSPEKPVQIHNTMIILYNVVKEREKSLSHLRIERSLFEPSSPKDGLCQVGLKFAQWF